MSGNNKMSAARISKAVIANAIAAAKSAGMTPTRVLVGADGSLVMDFGASELDTAEQMSDAPGPDRAKRWGEK
jgi:hypothetical protein